MLPGLELGAYTTRLIEPKAKEEAQKELKGKQLSLFDEQGLPTKTAEAARIKGDKAEANRLRQLQQREAAELKASQAKLKKFLAAKQGELNLTEAPPIAGVTVEGQPDLFGATPTATPAQPLAEPTVVSKPAKLTPKEVATKIDDGVLDALGIGRTARVRTDKLLDGKDISNPADAAEVRRILEAYADRKNLSTSIREKVEEYLNRPEFQQEVPSGPISEPAGPVGGAVQPSLPSDQQQPTFTSAPELIEEPVQGGVAVAGPAPVSVAGGEEGVGRPLGVRETKDITKAKAAAKSAVEEQQNFITQLEDDIGERLINMLPPGIDFSWIKDSDALKYFRIAPLIQEYVRLNDVVKNIGTPQNATEKEQLAKNKQELKVVRDALAKSGPNMEPVIKQLDADPNAAPAFIELANKAGRDAFAEGVRQEQEKNKPVQATATPVNVALDQEVEADYMADKFVSSNIAKAIQSGKVDDLIDAAISETDNPAINEILRKIKRMGLKTQIKVGKIKRKPGKMNVYDFGEFDPATNTVVHLVSIVSFYIAR